MLLALFGTVTVPLRAQPPQDSQTEIQALHQEVRLLEQRLDALEKSRSIAPNPSAPGAVVEAGPVINSSVPGPAGGAAPNPPPAKGGAHINADDSGFHLVSGDGSTSLHLGGIVQFDSREFFGDGGGALNNSFVLRRARVLTDGTFDNLYSFQFVPDFAPTTGVTIFDANAGISVADWLQVRVGKFKSPVGLEQLQQDAYTFFTERSLATNLVPNRDLGIQFGGSLDKGTLIYQVGIFNGVPDAANSVNQDFDNDKEAEARVFVQPFAASGDPLLSGLGFGAAATRGREKGTSGVASGYKTDGQQTFFKYSATTYADGDVWRFTPQGYWYAGPFGILGEYVVSAVNVLPTAPTKPVSSPTQLVNRSWDAQIGYTLTGENTTFAGVVPNHPFNPKTGEFGAWQVVARVEGLDVDPDAFPLFASSSTNAKDVFGWGFGLNWYLSRLVRISTDFNIDRFTLPAATSSTQILKQDERSLLSRVQIFF
ncbi:MAG TPA: porin [Opitutaceae bacterium]